MFYYSVSFEFQHNVCGRRVYAEGTADAVEFLSRVRSHKPTKRLYTMIDVLESGEMS
jgi:4-hydroxy-tetrahydrodipicolinate reductase